MCSFVVRVGRGCVAMTQSVHEGQKRVRRRALLLLCVALGAQTSDDPVAVFTEHPRLFLRPQRLRLLKRERERASPRWQQFETLVVGGAPMPEPRLRLGAVLPGRRQRRGRPQSDRMGADAGRRSSPAGAGLRLVPGAAERAAAAGPDGAPGKRHRGYRRRGDTRRALPDAGRGRPLRSCAAGAAARARHDRPPVVGTAGWCPGCKAGKSRGAARRRLCAVGIAARGPRQYQSGPAGKRTAASSRTFRSST